MRAVLVLVALTCTTPFAYAGFEKVSGTWILQGGKKFQIKKDGSMWVETRRFTSRGRIEHLGGERYVFHMDANPQDPCHVTISRFRDSDGIGINATHGGYQSCIQLFSGEAARVFDGDPITSIQDLAGEYQTHSSSPRNVTILPDGRFSHGNFGLGRIRHLEKNRFELVYDGDGSRDAGRKCTLWVFNPDVDDILVEGRGGLECSLGLLRRRATGSHGGTQSPASAANR